MAFTFIMLSSGIASSKKFFLASLYRQSTLLAFIYTRSIELRLLYRSEIFFIKGFFAYWLHDDLYELDRSNLCLEQDRATDDMIDLSWVFMQLIDFFFNYEHGSVVETQFEMLLTTIIDSDILCICWLLWELLELGLFLENELLFWIRLKLTSLLDFLVSSSLLSVVLSQLSSMLLMTRMDFFRLILIFLGLSVF